MKHLFLLGLMLLTISQLAMAVESKEHQDEPILPFIKEIK